MELKQTYEKIVPRACVGKHRAVRITVYVGYVAFALLWVAPIVGSLFSPTRILLAVLSTLILVLGTRKYLHVEYEYSFVPESLTVSKIFGKQRRKTLLAADMKKMLLVAPYGEDALREVERFSPDKTVDATASPESEDVLIVVYEEDSDTRILLFLESDAQIIVQFRRYAPHACSRELRSNLR